MGCAFYNNNEIAERLITKGADKDIKSQDG